MASNVRRRSIDSIKHRSLLNNKIPVSIKSETRATPDNISLFSPEAQKAMLMAREDIKENIASTMQSETTNPASDQQNNIPSTTGHNSNNITNNKNIKQDIKSKVSSKEYKFKSAATSLRYEGFRLKGSYISRKMAASAYAQTCVSRSRSTTTLADVNRIAIDGVGSSFTTNNNKNASKISKKNSTSTNATTGNAASAMTQKTESENNEKLSPEIIEKNGNENGGDVEIKGAQDKIVGPESFVLTLDKILAENKSISRLRGDITSTASISEPGKVRALDGGRLTNAQEVVVNVCYDDDRELIFNDDDDDSLINAKLVSDIKINLWMEYNQNFQPDDNVNDVCIDAFEDGNNNGCRSNDVAQPTEPDTRGRNSNKSASGTLQKNAKQNSKVKWQSMKNDVNNNSNSLIKSKSGSSTNLRDLSSSRTASTNRNDGQKNSRIQSVKKEGKS